MNWTKRKLLSMLALLPFGGIAAASEKPVINTIGLTSAQKEEILRAIVAAELEELKDFAKQLEKFEENYEIR